MDIRSIDEADSILSLDLLREWISAAFRRGATIVDPPGCSWGALVLAFHHAGLGSPSEPCSTEHTLRRHLVDFYMRQSTTMVNSIIQAKMGLDGTFFQRMGDQEVDRARVRWPWYLYCLTIAVSEPLEEGAARILLDLVDLQVLALRFRLAITVSQLVDSAVRLQPPPGTSALHAIHLVHHRGLWAPLLGARPPEKESIPLIDAVVELTGFSFSADAIVSGIGRCIGVVQSYDAEQDLYTVCLGDRGVLAERAQLKRIIYLSNAENSGDSMHGFGRAFPHGERRQNYGGLTVNNAVNNADNAPLAGIPDATLEWQLLHELVRREARFKLEQMMQELAGRDVVDTGSRSVRKRAAERAAEKEADFVDGAAKSSLIASVAPVDTQAKWHENPQDASVRAAPPAEMPSSKNFSAAVVSPAVVEPYIHYKNGVAQMRLPFDIMVEQMQDGSEFSICATADFSPCEGGQLALAIGDEIKLKHMSTEWVWGMAVGLLKPRTCPEQFLSGDGWCPRDCVTVWEARRRFRPDDSWERGRYLMLDIGDTVVVTMRYKGEWEGWGFGERWGDKQGAGVFHLSYLEPQVLVGQWVWSV